MNILAFDCAGMGGEIALSVNRNCATASLAQGEQATLLLPTIHRLLADAGLRYADLSAIVTTVGPGSFTGVRIGLAAVHGLVLAANIPLKCVTTLAALAWEAVLNGEAEPFTVAIRAGKGELYAQEFSPHAHAPRALSEIFLVPETHADWRLPRAAYTQVNAGVLCRIADHLPLSTLADAMPLYIRPPDAAIPKPHAWLVSPRD